MTDGHTFVTVSAGTWHTCAITTDGTAYCWGKNHRGQVGNSTTAKATTPAAVSGSHAFASARVGGEHSCGLTTGGTVYCWGMNEAGQLGDGTRATRSSPVRVFGQP